MAGALQGFLTYDPSIGLDSIGPEFIHDFELLSKKIYRQYHLKISFDDFMCHALEHACRSLAHYDPTRSISTFLFKIIWQCAYDSNKAMRREVFDSAEDLLEVGIHPEDASTHVSRDLDIDFRKGLCDLAQILYKDGIYLNQDRVYLDFLSGDSSPIVNAILWVYCLNPDDYTPKKNTLHLVLQRIATELNIDPAVVLSLYSVIDYNLFFVLDALKGSRLNVPRSFNLQPRQDA